MKAKVLALGLIQILGSLWGMSQVFAFKHPRFVIFLSRQEALASWTSVLTVEFARAQVYSQWGVSVWQHTLGG